MRQCIDGPTVKRSADARSTRPAGGSAGSGHEAARAQVHKYAPPSVRVGGSDLRRPFDYCQWHACRSAGAPAMITGRRHGTFVECREGRDRCRRPNAAVSPNGRSRCRCGNALPGGKGVDERGLRCGANSPEMLGASATFVRGDGLSGMRASASSLARSEPAMWRAPPGAALGQSPAVGLSGDWLSYPICRARRRGTLSGRDCRHSWARYGRSLRRPREERR